MKKQKAKSFLEFETNRANYNWQETIRLQHCLQWVMVTLKGNIYDRETIIEEIEMTLNPQNQRKEQ